jgi:hypothetical protein
LGLFLLYFLRIFFVIYQHYFSKKLKLILTYKNITNRNLFLFGILLILIGLPLSKFLMSIGQFVLLGSWLAEGDWKDKWKKNKLSFLFWVLVSFFILHLIGLLWTSNFEYALHDLKIKLPLLWFPLLFFTTKHSLSKKEIYIILWIFVISVLIASIICLFIWLGITKYKVVDVRDISIFNSHIRFALMIDLSIAFLFYYSFLENKKKWIPLKLIFAVWLIIFLFIMQSVTGIIILFLILLYFLIRNIFLKINFKVKILLSSIISLFISFGFFWIQNEVIKQFEVNKKNIKKIKTENNNIYYHNSLSKEMENGYLVWSNISFVELEPTWNRRSDIKFNENDAKGNPISSTIIRFITSKGYCKDASGVNKLSDSEIKLIQNGVTNYLYTNQSGISSRIHEFIYEYHSFKTNSNPSGHTLLMRLEFWKTGLLILKQNWIIGVGTGDVQDEFNLQYQRSGSQLKIEWWKRAHNQFLTITITFGFIGLIIFLVYLFAPAINLKNKHDLFIVFMIISLVSMLNEDTLETQAGVTFFGFFYSFFLMEKSKIDK